MSHQSYTGELGLARNSPPKPLLSEDLRIRRTRLVHLIIHAIILMLAFVYMILSLVLRPDMYRTALSALIFWFLHGLIWTLLSAFGLLVAYKYHDKGLRIFGWIHIILLVIDALLVGIPVSMILYGNFTDRSKNYHEALEFIGIVSIMYITIFIFRV
ncbi:unnamed protein product [Adineta ricciae]|uniref:Uncharacterized protein n=1 Tax=Adineta ricciae TaxID=249248 RepID=A0A815HC60_ADIRI|nr:unnamed protein product [Adineta ricciae]